MSHSTVAILGGGPIGLEALVACQAQGIDAVLYERNEIGFNLKKWQHVRLFSPFQLNHSKTGAKLLGESGIAVPSDEELLTGREYLKNYLEPLAQLPAIKNCIQSKTEVIHIARERLLKGELIGSATRTESRFRLHLTHNNQPNISTADYVLDCTGTFGNHNWLGSGGIPCLGEKEFSDRIDYGLPEVLGADKERHIGKTTLVIGTGYSAATNIVALAKLIKEEPATQVYWLTRHDRELPLQPIPNDTLLEREQLTNQANHLAISKQSGVAMIRNSVVESISQPDDTSGKLNVQVRVGSEAGNSQDFIVDRIIANVGFRPDRSIYEELQVHECYATHGPMKLAATLMGETSADCLAQTSHGVAALKSPEPNFYILGSKSYGRSSRFLIKIGLEQVEEVVNDIATSCSTR